MDLSRKYLDIKCEICGEMYSQQERVFKKAKWKYRCKKHRGEFNKQTCIDCGIEIYKDSTRCKTCSGKQRTIRDQKYCKCGNKIEYRSSKCLKCHNAEQDKGMSKERTKFQNSKEWRNIRVECFARDGYLCQICNSIGNQQLECHHIKPYAQYIDLRLSIDNLMTVCYDCHKYIHFGNHIRS
jgi:5-methylcytosine-specific restriction protein A